MALFEKSLFMALFEKSLFVCTVPCTVPFWFSRKRQLLLLQLLRLQLLLLQLLLLQLQLPLLQPLQPLLLQLLLPQMLLPQLLLCSFHCCSCYCCSCYCCGCAAVATAAAGVARSVLSCTHRCYTMGRTYRARSAKYRARSVHGPSFEDGTVPKVISQALRELREGHFPEKSFSRR